MKKTAAVFFMLMVLGLLSNKVMADTTTSIFNCPTTFRSIQLGNTMEEVQAACGVASSTTTKQVQIAVPTTTVQWTYVLGWLNVGQSSVFLPSLTLIFNNNKVTQITRSGTPITLGAYCVLNGIINIGDSMDKVLLICGRPSMVSESQQANTVNKTLVEWIYNYGPYRPQIILDFENDRLTQITTGQLGS